MECRQPRLRQRQRPHNRPEHCLAERCGMHRISQRDQRSQMEQGQRLTSRQWLCQARRHTHWCIRGHLHWLPLGTEVALGAGYRQTVQLAVTRRGCDERECEQGMAVGDPYVMWWYS